MGDDDSLGLSGASDSKLSFGGDPELPNILFSRPPPWEEKLLRLLPATLLFFACKSREETGEEWRYGYYGGTGGFATVPGDRPGEAGLRKQEGNSIAWMV